jgi:phosphoglycolate phosphatase
MFKAEAIVWDLDGTLVDSAPDLATALNTVLDMRGFANHSLETIRGMIGNGVPKLIERGFNAIGVRLQPEQLEQLIPIFVKVYSECATEQTRPYPHIVETLEQLQAMNIPMGVCTNKPEALSRQILDGLDLSKYFSSVVGGDTTSTRKPDPQPLLRCLQELVTEPKAAMMIGDSTVDVDAARAAGVEVGVVPWGYRSLPVENLGADFILEDLTELPKLIHIGTRKVKQVAH